MDNEPDCFIIKDAADGKILLKSPQIDVVSKIKDCYEKEMNRDIIFTLGYMHRKGVLTMQRYQLIQAINGKILHESDSYSFILWASRRYEKMELSFRIVDQYTGKIEHTFEPVIM